ncbi:hypothetical protein OHB24_26960 [Kribbella sp. NBC_00482]|uniref:hypothetical protein n=1 Tax=Kribbella sp. NBC_00482 TaxID=2975968 RepID=UPI002E17A52C
MTAPSLDLRRRPTRAAGNLFRVTAAVSFLTLPLLWAVYLLRPLAEPDSCPPDAREACPPSLDTVGGSVNELVLLLATACLELMAIACYLAWAAARRNLDLRSGLRWSPLAITIVALAVGGFGWLIDEGDLNGIDSVALGLLLLFALWLFTPLALYGVHRGDRRAVIPVVVGLAPTAVCNAIVVPDAPVGALPAVMLVVSAVVVVIVRRRE